MKTILCILFFIPFLWINAQKTYYVSNSGSNSDDGTTKTTAWQTIAHLNSQSFAAGDSILFEAGGTWRETLSIITSGTSDNYITYGSYGDGERPGILGSIQATSWTNTSGNIWSSSTDIDKNPYEIGYSAQIFFGEKSGSDSWGHYETYDAGFSNLTNEYDWTWNDNTISIYSQSNPEDQYTAIEAPQRYNGVTLNDHEYISFDNLFIGYLVAAGVRDKYPPSKIHGLRVTNCEIAYIGIRNSGQAFGLSVWHSDAYFANNEIHDCGRRSISINVYDTEPHVTLENILIENNLLYNGFHTTGVDCINSGGHLINNVVIRNNYIKGDPTEDLGGEDGQNSNHVFVAKQGTGDVTNIYIYNNLFTYVHGKGVGFEGVDHAFVYFNTFYGVNPTLSSFSAHIASNMGSDVNIKNNIFYSDLDHSFFEDFFSIYYTGSTEPNNFNIDYNLYYTTDPTAAFANIYIPGSYEHRYKMTDWSAFKSENGWGANSPPPADPVFIDAPDNLGLQETSPARNAGVDIELIEKDFFYNDRVSPQDLGAIQFGSKPQTGIETKDTQSISFFPNPATDYVTISISDNLPLDPFYIRMFNLSGKLVYKSSDYKAQRAINISLNGNIPQGVYYVELVFGNSVSVSGKLLIVQ